MSKIIVLMGCSMTGKDSIGEQLVENHGYKQVSFGDAVKEQYAKDNGLNLEILHIQGPDKESHRDGMIKLAEDARAIDPLHWLKKAFEPYIDNSTGRFMEGLKLVVTDCRRFDEIDWVIEQKIQHFAETSPFSNVKLISESLEVYLWHVKRPSVELLDKDVLTHYCIGYARAAQRYNDYSGSFEVIDFTIINNNCLKSLRDKVDFIVKSTNSAIFN